MKIGVNIKKIQNLISTYVDEFYETFTLPSMQYLENRINTLENKSSEWIEITSSNGQEAEITQQFTEIKLQARGMGTLYSVTCNYDNIIFHNSSSDAPTYMICGNPTQNNYGCKFKYMVNNDGNQYVCVDKCFSGGSQEGIEFRAWIKPVPSELQ